MRRKALLCALLLGGCGGADHATTPADNDGSGAVIPEKAARAAALAKELEANPDDAVAILEKHGLTQQQFEELMYEIAEDEQLSKAYEKARGR